MNLLNFFKDIIKSNNETKKIGLLITRLLVNQNNLLYSGNSLSSFEFSVYSQWGEDGIIQWLISKMPKIPCSFVEFGVENYLESNTRLLLEFNNWSGLVIDGSIKNIDEIKKQDIYWRHDLLAFNNFVTSENINDLLANSGFKNEIGILSIDIDGNDYWVWDAINVLNPVIVVSEYNAVLGDMLPLTIPYKADFVRSEMHFSNLYFGSSIRALILLGEKKGYTFIGTTSTGANAFFVRNDFADSVIPSIKNICAFPSKFREARNTKGKLEFTSGIQRRNIINHLPFLDLSTNKVGPLSSYGEIYSSSWKKGESVNF